MPTNDSTIDLVLGELEAEVIETDRSAGKGVPVETESSEQPAATTKEGSSVTGVLDLEDVEIIEPEDLVEDQDFVVRQDESAELMITTDEPIRQPPHDLYHERQLAPFSTA